MAASAIGSKAVNPNRVVTLAAGALPDSADPVGFPILILWSLLKCCCHRFVSLMHWSQSRDTFRALLRREIGESIPFSTLQNRNQVYSKLTGRRLACAQRNMERYAFVA